MYNTAAYTHINGDVQKVIHLEQQKTNFALIGQYGVDIFNMASVRHTGLVVTSPYCIRELYSIFLTLCQIFRSTVLYCLIYLHIFQHLGLKLPISTKIWGFFFGDLGQIWKWNILFLKRHTLAWFRAFWTIMRQNPSKGLISTRAWVNAMNSHKTLYFTHFPRRPLDWITPNLACGILPQT